MSSKNVEDFKDRLSIHFKKSKNSILEIGIKYQDDTTFYSWNNTEQKRHFGLGSVTKTIISTYICDMIQKNKLDIHLSINHYLDLDSKRKYPTLLSLLTHTSGYHSFIPLFPTMKSMILHGFNKKNIYEDIDSKWLATSVKKHRPLKKKKYRYSDYNYAILAMIIEKIEKRPYQDILLDFMKNEIGMNNSYYGSLKSTKNDKFSWTWEDYNPFLASGGLFSTTEDMIKFLDYQIKQKELLSLAHQKYHRTNINKNVFTGFSWISFYNGHFFWHIGGQGYYRSYALFDLKKNLSISILSTVDVDIQHVNRLGSSLYRNVKRNNKLIMDCLKQLSD